jgi:hypothetical protein
VSSFKPILGESHEGMDMNVIFKATNKEFMKEISRHALCSENQLVKRSYVVFQCTQLFQLGQMTQMTGVSVKAFIKVNNKPGSSNIPLV